MRNILGYCLPFLYLLYIRLWGTKRHSPQVVPPIGRGLAQRNRRIGPKGHSRVQANQHDGNEIVPCHCTAANTCLPYNDGRLGT
jgi:hypothetical protein